MSLIRILAFRAISLFAVLIAVLFLSVIVLGATGFSDKLLTATVSEDLRGMRQSLAENIKDPDELDKVLSERRVQLVEFYGLDKPWYYRLPDMVFRILQLDLGESRSLRSFDGSNQVGDIVNLTPTIAEILGFKHEVTNAGLVFNNNSLFDLM